MARKTVIIISDDDIKVIVEDESGESKKIDIEPSKPVITTRAVRTGKTDPP